MPFTPQDEIHLAQALNLAQQAAAFASPNPTVGCVLTRDNFLLGEGAHHFDERDHAEIVALKRASAAGRSVRGATAYVTLEPCCHQGRTGPCANALIASGIQRCVVATVDPNPLVRGQGLALLHAASVEVTLLDPCHPLAQQARRLNDAFARFIQKRRPFVTLKAALSADGKLAPAPSTRTAKAPHWITGTAARADAQLLRHASDALLTGIGTILADNPALTDRTGLPRRRPLLRVVLDSELRTPPDSHLVTADADSLLILHAQDPTRFRNASATLSARSAALTGHGADVLSIPTLHQHLNLDAVLSELAKRQILSVLVEAGSEVNASFLSADLVDRVVLYYSMIELGCDAVSFASGFGSSHTLQQRLTHADRVSFSTDLIPNGEDVRISGYLHDPWAGVA